MIRSKSLMKNRGKGKTACPDRVSVTDSCRAAGCRRAIECERQGKLADFFRGFHDISTAWKPDQLRKPFKLRRTAGLVFVRSVAASLSVSIHHLLPYLSETTMSASIPGLRSPADRVGDLGLLRAHAR